MNYCFPTFSVDTTNIFPIANSTKGGQLVTEFNLKSRESVSYYESVKYNCGPSYAHSEDDFKISSMMPSDNYFPDDNAFSSSILRIAPGRAVVDGHYIENLSEMAIDIAVKNQNLHSENKELISGDLAVGLKVMYSTEQTMMGSIDAEHERERGSYYTGIQVVIVPFDELMLPTTKKVIEKKIVDCGLPENKEKVNMHLLLATFTYFNGNISNIVNNYPGKCQMLPATRIGKIDDIISDEYIKRTGLDEAKIYAFAGKGVNSVSGKAGKVSGYDTWCDVTDSLVKWTEKVELTKDAPTVKSAKFITDNIRSEVYMHLPHKQVDGAGYSIHDKDGKVLYYKPTKLTLPTAGYAEETPGIVDKWYTKNIKNELKSLKDVNLMHMTNGKLICYISSIDSLNDLPALNPKWNPGDYILVGSDSSMIEDAVDPLQSAPSTMYVILPGFVTGVKNEDTADAPNSCTGVQLASFKIDSETLEDQSTKEVNTYIKDSDGNYIYRGRKDADYFDFCVIKTNGEEEPEVTETHHYRSVSETDGSLSYSDPILITPQIPFATETMVGGFLNVPENTVDAGYVYLDDTGHLRLLDYALLRSGTLAYQLGENYTVPSGIDIPSIQGYLDEYVNQRIAFPNENQIENAENPNIIDITINITKSDEEDEESDTDKIINIYDIDSRFNTAVRVNILGEADDSVTINISDCAKVIINLQISGNPVINLYRSGLYYDATILNRLNVISDMNLWYEKLKDDDPDITVEGMTARLVRNQNNFNSDYSIADAEYWSPVETNDFHFKVALQSLSFTSSGNISGCTVLVSSDTTANVVNTGKFIIHSKDFILPQGTFAYPEKRFNCPIKITGQFIHSYKNNSSSNSSYCIQNTSFSIKTQYYAENEEYHSSTDDSISYGSILGEAAFYVDVSLVKCDKSEDIDVWSSGEYHVFSGNLIQ